MNMIKNALHNLSESENNNLSVTTDQLWYYRGLVIGIVSALMDSGLSFGAALRQVRDNLPADSIPLDKIVPDWNEELKALESE